MSDSKFGGPPQTGKQVSITTGHPPPTPYHAEVWRAGQLSVTRKFATHVEAENFQQEEIKRP